MNDVNIITFWVYLTLERDATFKCQFDFGLVQMQLQKFFRHYNFKNIEELGRQNTNRIQLNT